MHPFQKRSGSWVAGEVFIGGIQVARGYLGQPEQTAAKFLTDASGERWFRSGDRGRWVPRASGTGGSGGRGVVYGEKGEGADRMVLQVLGRFDGQIKLRGFRIEVEEVEAVLASSSLITSAAVTLHVPSPTPSHVHSPSPTHSALGPTHDGSEIPEEVPGVSEEARERLVAYVVLSVETDATGVKTDVMDVERGVERDAAGEMEEGGETALRMLCQRRMPAHQVPPGGRRAAGPPRTHHRNRVGSRAGNLSHRGTRPLLPPWRGFPRGCADAHGSG
ncbi:hypothetical protein T484DRAFT_1920853 [Baffinella frigidus]|nr:hypothetical protein T484DRAFT_1920853 [Cryptophyta sp. CCMP2293]